jgi:hypothetical protein
MRLNRRQFGKLGIQSAGATAVAGLLSQRIWAEPARAAASPESFYFANIADTHIIDEFYVKGSENGVEDNTTILQTTDHLTFTRSVINAIQLPNGQTVERTFLVGDVFHNYPSTDYDFYFKNRTRIDNAADLLAGFKMPVHMGWGNHDYDGSGKVSREISHKLFEAKLKTKPYYAVDYKGFRFVHLNNFLGATWDEGSDPRMRQYGSLGEEQLNWAEAQLHDRKPTVVYIHYPLWIVAPTEVKDYGLHPLLRKYSDNIQIIISGHWHKWIDFAHTYGAQHTVMGSTRYDQNSFMLMQADPKKGTVRWVDAGRPEWSTHYATPYKLG